MPASSSPTIDADGVTIRVDHGTRPTAVRFRLRGPAEARGLLRGLAAA